MNTSPAPCSHHSPKRVERFTAIVIHDTGGKSATSALVWFADPTSKVSSHLVIDRGGVVYQPVPFDRVAWHAGTSILHGEPEVNQFSYGIELVDDRDAPDDPYPTAQMQALTLAVVELCDLDKIPLNRVIGHEQIATPRGRKADPGKDFPWYEFLKQVGTLLP